jgi:hypothetical protein
MLVVRITTMPTALSVMVARAATVVTAISTMVVTTAVVADPDVYGRSIPAATTIATPVVIRGRISVVVVIRIAGVVTAGVTTAHVGIVGIDATREREDRDTDQYPQEIAHGELRLLACEQASAARFNVT